MKNLEHLFSGLILYDLLGQGESWDQRIVGTLATDPGETWDQRIVGTLVTGQGGNLGLEDYWNSRYWSREKPGTRGSLELLSLVQGGTWDQRIIRTLVIGPGGTWDQGIIRTHY